jgi:hypothetical protein
MTRFLIDLLGQSEIFHAGDRWTAIDAVWHVFGKGVSRCNAMKPFVTDILFSAIEIVSDRS